MLVNMDGGLSIYNESMTEKSEETNTKNFKCKPVCLVTIFYTYDAFSLFQFYF